MKQDQAIKELPLMNKFEAMVLIRINKEKPLSYAHMIQEVMLSKERSSSSEDRRQRFISEYPWQKRDEDDCHTTLLSQELQELSQRKVLSVITNVEDQSDHNHYILQETVYYMIQEVMLSKEKSSSSEGRSQRFISEYILSKYPSLKNDDDDRRHTTLLSQELTQRKVLSLTINVEDQSANDYILQETLYCENTGAERPTTVLHLLLLRAANYPRVVAQQPQGGRDGEGNNDIGIMEKKTRKLKYKSAREINRRMDDGLEGTGINVDVEVGIFDDDQVARIEKDSFRRTDTNTVNEPKDDDGEEVAGEEEHQEEEVREEEEEEEEGQEEEYQEEEVGGEEGGQDEEEGGQDEDEEEDEDVNEEDDDEDEDEDEDEDDEEEVIDIEEAAAAVAEAEAAEADADAALVELAEAKAALAKAVEAEAALSAAETAAETKAAAAKAAAEAALAELMEAQAVLAELAKAQAALRVIADHQQNDDDGNS